MDDLIQRLDRGLATYRPDYYDRLLPGVTDAELDAFEKRFTLQLPIAFRQLYRWRNGQEMMDFEPLQFNFTLSSLEEISISKEELDEMIGADFEDPSWWRSSWVPFLFNGGGDHLCLDLTAEDGGTPGQIISFYHDYEARPIEFPSLEDWLLDLVKSIEDETLELA
jgi:cell wall assembly regulator SMI1